MISHQGTTPSMNTPSRTPAAPRGPRPAALAFLVLLVAVLALPIGSASPINGHLASAAPVGAPLGVAPPTIVRASAPTSPLDSAVAAHLRAGDPALLRADPLRWLGPGQGFAPVPATPSGPIAGAGAGPGSSSSNYYVSGSDCSGWYGGQLFVPWISGSSIAQVGASNQTLVAAGGTMNEIFNGSTGSPCVSGIIDNYTLKFGYGAVYRTADAGQQWTQYPVAPNDTLWVENASESNDSIATGNEYVAGSSDGSAAVITGYAPACAAIPIAIKCGGLHGIYGPWGFAISTSHDGGFTWSNASQVSAANGLDYITMSSTCQSLGFTSGIYVNNIPENPWIVMNSSLMVAGWDVLTQAFVQSTCSFQVNAVVQVVTSTDGGVTWSAPTNLTNTVTDSVSFGLSVPASHTIYAVAIDSGNYSAGTNTIYFSFQKSTNNGATWSTEGDITSLPVHVTSVAASAPDQFSTAQRPVLAVDNWTTSPYEGTLYLVWQDNNTGSYQGYPTIAFSKSTNGGSTWSAPVFLTGQTTQFSYVEPALSVGPDGTVWVDYYGINESGAANGAYNVYGVASTNGGTTWTPQFRVSDSSSYPGTTPGAGSSVLDLGYYMGSAATSAGLIPIWSDCRNVACSTALGGTGFDVQHYTAIVELVNFSSNAPSASGPSALVTTDGTVTNYGLPAELGWELGSSHLVRVPETLPYNATAVEAFTGLSGLSTATSVSTTVTVNQLAVGLVAQYTPTPATFIEGSITPLVAGTTLTLDSLPVSLTSNATADLYTVVVPQNGQSHWLNVSAPNYQSIHKLVATNAAGITWQNFTLVRLNGTIKVSVAASEGFGAYTSEINNATVLVDGLPAILSNGAVSVTVPFGEHNVSASLAGFVSSQSPSNPINVLANQVKTVTFTFTGGWINGTVVPAVSGEVLRIDGASVSVSAVGQFSAGVPGGFHNLTATATGYNLSTIRNIGVTPLSTHLVNVTLTNHGWIAGIVGPLAALTTAFVRISSVTGSTVLIPQLSKTTGAFNESVPAGTWNITTTATNYKTNYTIVSGLTAGNGSYLPITLAVSQVCTSNCGNNHNNTTNGTKNTTGGGGGGISTLDILLIVVAVIVVVGVLAAVMMMRRRGGSDSEPDYNQNPPDQQVYGDSSTSELPKLQSDGSMTSPPPPPPPGA